MTFWIASQKKGQKFAKRYISENGMALQAFKKSFERLKIEERYSRKEI